MKVKEGVKVVCNDSYFAEEHAGAVGEIVTIIPGAIEEFTIAIVKYHDAVKRKIPLMSLEVVKQDPLDDKITITRKHFRDLILLNFGGMSLALVGEKLKNLEYDLFGEPSENV